MICADSDRSLGHVPLCFWLRVFQVEFVVMTTNNYYILQLLFCLVESFLSAKVGVLNELHKFHLIQAEELTWILSSSVSHEGPYAPRLLPLSSLSFFFFNDG